MNLEPDKPAWELVNAIGMLLDQYNLGYERSVVALTNVLLVNIATEYADLGDAHGVINALHRAMLTDMTRLHPSYRAGLAAELGRRKTRHDR